MEPSVLDLFLRTLDECYSAETIKRTLDLLIARGFRLIAEEESDQSNDVMPGASPKLQHELQEYLAHQRELLHIRPHYLGEEEMDFSFHLFLDPKEGTLECMVSSETIQYEESEGSVYFLLLDIYRDLYHIWHPFYGYEEYAGGMIFSRKVITHQKVNYLYATNLFGPEMVQTWGRDRILSAPAWKIEELDDGGIFLAPVKQMTSRGGGYSWKKVADYLGKQTPQAPGQEWEELDEEDGWDDEE